MKIERHHYHPTETQRAEIKLAAQVLKQRIAEKRRQREAFEIAERRAGQLREAVQELKRLGFDDQAAEEIADLRLTMEGQP